MVTIKPALLLGAIYSANNLSGETGELNENNENIWNADDGNPILDRVSRQHGVGYTVFTILYMQNIKSACRRNGFSRASNGKREVKLHITGTTNEFAQPFGEFNSFDSTDETPTAKTRNVLPDDGICQKNVAHKYSRLIMQFSRRVENRKISQSAYYQMNPTYSSNQALMIFQLPKLNLIQLYNSKNETVFKSKNYLIFKYHFIFKIRTKCIKHYANVKWTGNLSCKLHD